MMRSKYRQFLVLAIVLMAAAGAFAQDRGTNTFTADKYLVSARAGGVNYVQGNVGVSRATGKSGSLMKGDILQIGDRVLTDGNSRIEVLMNPGSYIRLGANSSFEFKTTSLDDLQVRLDAGSAMFEVFAADEFTVTVFTPKGRTLLVQSGVYRFDVSADGNATVAVTEGKALVGPAEILVKKGRTGTIGNSLVMVAKFDRGKRDDLGEWSKTRAKDLAKVTHSLRNNDVRLALASSLNNRRWGFRDSFGLWVFDPFSRNYCFLPFGYGWYSPYGYGFNNSIYWYNLPAIVNVPIRQPVVPAEPTKAGRNPVTRSYEPPPYVTLEKTRDSVRPTTRGFDFPADASRPSRSFDPPASVPVYIPAPAPVVRTGDKPGN